jgi:2-polyprenyl-3-methyl-5-hydroxy-6-metoxy-1,4-benzoquinol methylase
MTSNDYRRIAHLLEHVLLHLYEILEILGRDERFREEIMHLPVPIYVVRELREQRQAVHEELSEVRESLNMISSKIDKLTLNFTTTHQLVNEIVLKGMCPYCQKDLMAYIKNDELLLMCRNQGTDMCKTYAWAITKVRQVSL